MTIGDITLPGLERRAHRQAAYRLATQAAPHLWLPSLLLLAVVLVCLAYQFVSPLTVQVGPQDRRFIHDAHALEDFAEIGRQVRWTSDRTRLDLPVVAAGAPLLLDLALINSYPPGTPAPTVGLLLDGERLARLVIPRQSEAGMRGTRRYHVLIPPQQRAGWHLPLTLRSTTILRSEDPRPLGVMLVEAQTAALATGPLLPPPWQVAALLLCATAGYIGLRGAGVAPRLAWGLLALLLLALAVGLAWWHLQIAPFTMRLAGLLGLVALYGLVVQRLATPGGRISSRRLPLLLGLAYWLMPAFQLIMTADGARALTPYPPTLWLAIATLVSSLLVLWLLAVHDRAHQWEAGLLAVLAVAAVAHLVILIAFALGRSGPDFWILFRGARDWFRGGSLYNLVAVQENHFGHVFKVPPFYGMLFLPFVQRDGLEMLLWHRLLNIGLVVATILLLFGAFRVRLFSALGVGLLLLFAMRPLTDTIAFGQIDILLLLLLSLALVAARSGRVGLAGALIGLGTLFKLYPVLLLAFFLARREWRAVAGFGLALLVCNGIALAVIGWEMHATYLFEVVPRIGGGTSWVENQTLNGFLSRLVAQDIDASPMHHPLVSLLTYGGFLLALGGAVVLARRPAAPQSPRYVLQFGLFLILMVLTVPAAWMHYQTIVILPFFGLLLASATSDQDGSNGAEGTGVDGLPRWRAALLGVAYALVAFGNQWSFFNGTIMGGLTLLGASYKFYGLVLLLAVTVACLLDRPAPHEHARPQEVAG